MSSSCRWVLWALAHIYSFVNADVALQDSSFNYLPTNMSHSISASSSQFLLCTCKYFRSFWNATFGPKSRCQRSNHKRWLALKQKPQKIVLPEILLILEMAASHRKLNRCRKQRRVSIKVYDRQHRHRLVDRFLRRKKSTFIAATKHNFHFKHFRLKRWGLPSVAILHL